MPSFDDFSDITQRDKPLCEFTWLGTGGPAQYFIEPRHVEELAEVLRCCHAEQIPVHVLGGGSNVLVRDEGVSGAVIRLTADAFGAIEVNGTTVTCGAAALLSQLISASIKAGLGGLEVLAGIPGTVGGAIKGNAGGRHGEIGQFVRSVRGLTAEGEFVTRNEDELSFSYRTSGIDALVLLDATLELHEEDSAETTRRMRKTWIMKKATQPLTFQSAGCIFKNPRGMSAGTLIDQAALKGTRVGGAEISERHANFIITHPGATSEDVLRLIDLIRSKINEQFGVQLELEIQVW